MRSSGSPDTGHLTNGKTINSPPLGLRGWQQRQWHGIELAQTGSCSLQGQQARPTVCNEGSRDNILQTSIQGFSQADIQPGSGLQNKLEIILLQKLKTQ
uniref:Uncharacterized protein n=1 Tax=Triticum urartu TaxID=4572 RepID=A0A8R7Q3F0_TRIUA